jgi:hypothetical protein
MADTEYTREQAQEAELASLQFKLVDAKSALHYAADDSASPEVANFYRKRALEVAEVISALAALPSASLGERKVPSNWRELLNEPAPTIPAENPALAASPASKGAGGLSADQQEQSRGGEG